MLNTTQCAFDMFLLHERIRSTECPGSVARCVLITGVDLNVKT
jgi:hypothetical protein